MDKYCDSKSDQKGKRTLPKHCYPNLFDYRMCVFTALGRYFCLNDKTWDSERGTILCDKIEKQGTKTHKYCE